MDSQSRGKDALMEGISLISLKMIIQQAKAVHQDHLKKIGVEKPAFLISSLIKSAKIVITTSHYVRIQCNQSHIPLLHKDFLKDKLSLGGNQLEKLNKIANKWELDRAEKWYKIAVTYIHGEMINNLESYTKRISKERYRFGVMKETEKIIAKEKISDSDVVDIVRDVIPRPAWHS